VLSREQGKLSREVWDEGLMFCRVLYEKNMLALDDEGNVVNSGDTPAGAFPTSGHAETETRRGAVTIRGAKSLERGRTVPLSRRAARIARVVIPYGALAPRPHTLPLEFYVPRFPRARPRVRCGGRQWSWLRLSPGGPNLPNAHTPTTATPTSAAASPIKHIVIMVKENHSFDNLFGAFPRG
jgi:hypothetical protein